MCAGSISWLRKAAHNKQKRENMIIRLHGKEVSPTSRGTPSFEDDFVDESDDSLREEFLELLDKAANTAQKGTQADQALGASIVAAGSISVVTPRVDVDTRQESKPIFREVGAPTTEREQIATTVSEDGKQGVDSSVQNPLANRAFTSNGKESGRENEKEVETSRFNETASADELSAGEREIAQGESSSDEAPASEEALLTEDGLLLPDGSLLTTSETSEEGADTLAQVGEGFISAEASLPSETSVETLPASTPADSAKIAESTVEALPNEVPSAAISAEGVPLTQSVSSAPSSAGGAQNGGTVQVTAKGGSELANLLASMKQEQITLRMEEGNKKQVELANPFLSSAIPLLQRPDAAVKLALLKQSFEQLKGAISDVKGAQGSAQTLSSQMGAQGQISGGAVNVALGEVASKGQLGFQKEASRPLPKGIAHRTMERVESALKEAAKSRDGKTLSFRLDPPQLGQVKVDVSLKDGALHARMVPENAQVASLLREKASELQSTLRRLGLNVETVTVSVGNESDSISYNGGESSLDGKTFQQERNKMPGQEAQVVETTFGNELALQGPATKTVVDDHWVA
jgi:flagellar hook-length control protein FliK